MQLLDRVVEWSPDWIRCATSSHLDPAHPLRTARGLRAVHLCEYGAQAMAAHGTLARQGGGRTARPGLLVSLRDVELKPIDVGTCRGELLVAATRVAITGGAWKYDFVVSFESLWLARGGAMVAFPRA